MNKSSQTNEAGDHANITITPEYWDMLTKVTRVPPHFKNKQTYREVYDPVMVSLGPYHHGKQQYKQSQITKQEAFLDALASGSHDENFYLGKLLNHIEKIRFSYSEEIVYDDNTLATIVLYDACFIISVLNFVAGRYYSEYTIDPDFIRVKSFIRDLMLLENQIPFWIIKYLLSLKFDSMEEGNNHFNTLLWKFIAKKIHGTSSSPIYDRYPFHFLDAAEIYLSLDMMANRNIDIDPAVRHVGYWSITNLNTKGIRLKVNHTNNSFNFTSHTLYGELEVPPIDMTYDGFLLFSNLIAYEMTSTITNIRITSYINFMRSLIEGPNDVKIMREEGVLVGEIGSADEVYKMFKDLETYGINNPYMFFNLKREIESHCTSKAKTWMAELYHTYLRSPWTIIALVAAIVLLCLTFVQTFYTVHPPEE